MRVPFQCTEEDIRLSGLICPSHQPCPVFLELADVESAGDKLFASGNVHTESATLTSILLASEDAGKSWYEPNERIRGAGLDQIQFFDFQSGWISGQTLGLIPRDPFVLLTTDGGKSWRARPVFNESRPGFIEYFRFDSKTHGWLWIDRTRAADTERYEAYESNTGGESWSLRQTSGKPLRKRPSRGSGPASAWRVRADAATKSYRIERQAAPNWEQVASFLIRAGECKEPETVLPPPPEEPKPPEAEPAPTPAKPTPPSLRKP